MQSPDANRAAGTVLHVFSAVMPPSGGASSIPEASRLNASVSGIPDRPAKAGDDTEWLFEIQI